MVDSNTDTVTNQSRRAGLTNLWFTNEDLPTKYSQKKK